MGALMNFETAFGILIDPQHEGAYAFDPADPGGETMFGITARVARRHGYIGAMKDLSLAMAQEIAEDEYWKPARCDDLPDAIRFDMFDASYNVGVHEAIVLLQRAIAQEPDGVLGPMTLTAIGAADVEWLRRSFNAARLRFYAQLPTWASFGKGWVNRVAANLARP
jgi:lysozyme family protein